MASSPSSTFASSSSGGAKLQGFEGLAAGAAAGAAASSSPPKLKAFDGFGAGASSPKLVNEERIAQGLGLVAGGGSSGLEVSALDSSEPPKLVNEDPIAHGLGFVAGGGSGGLEVSSDGAKDDPNDQGFADVEGGGLEVSAGASSSSALAPKAHGLAEGLGGLGGCVSAASEGDGEPKDQGFCEDGVGVPASGLEVSAVGLGDSALAEAPPNAHGLLSFPLIVVAASGDATGTGDPNPHELLDVAAASAAPPSPAPPKLPPQEKVPLSIEAEGAKLGFSAGASGGLGVSASGGEGDVVSEGRCSRACSWRPALS